MSRLGLSGKAFIPMLLGFGCTVPAIMASRALESKRDRYKVMLVTPFMSCNARLTIYILFSEMFFGKYAMLVAYSMYLIGIVVAIAVSLALHLIDKKAEANYLLIELPEYKMPDLRTVGIYVWDKVKDYLGKAGTTIFLATLLIWALLNFGPEGYSPDPINRCICPCRAWILADYGSVDCWYISEGSCSLKLRCAVWDSKCQFTRWDGKFCRGAGANWVRGVKCILPYGILPALYSLCGGIGDGT